MTFNPFKGWKEALSEYGWLIPTVLVILLAIFVGAQYYESTRIVPTSALPGTTTNIIAREPGVAFDVATFCNEPNTIVTGGSFVNFAPDSLWNYKYVLKNGNESVEWKTANVQDPSKQNIAADHFIIPASGIQQALPQVEMTKNAVACVYRKGGVPKG